MRNGARNHAAARDADRIVAVHRQINAAAVSLSAETVRRLSAHLEYRTAVKEGVAGRSVKTMPSISGSSTGPPAESEYAVEARWASQNRRPPEAVHLRAVHGKAEIEYFDCAPKPRRRSARSRCAPLIAVHRDLRHHAPPHRLEPPLNSRRSRYKARRAPRQPESRAARIIKIGFSAREACFAVWMIVPSPPTAITMSQRGP